MKAKIRTGRIFQRSRAAGLLLAVCSVLASAGVWAANTATFTISATIKPGTCQMRAVDVSKTVDLPEVRVADFAHADSAGARDDFSIVVENCRGVAEAEFAFGGTPYPTDGERFKNNGTASNVGLWLYSRIGGNNATIRADGVGGANKRTVSVISGAAELPLGAAYWKTGAVTGGSLNSVVTVTMTYR